MSALTAFRIGFPDADPRSVGAELASDWRGTFFGGQLLRADPTCAVTTVEDDFDRSVPAAEALDLAFHFR